MRGRKRIEEAIASDQKIGSLTETSTPCSSSPAKASAWKPTSNAT